MAHTEETLRELLKKIASEHEYTNCEVSITQIFTGGANYTSKLYTVVIKEPNKDDLHLFAKVATIGKQLRIEFPPIFDTERYFYTTLCKSYQSLEEEFELPEEHRLSFSKYYGCDPSVYRETVVLENLLVRGYGPHNRFKSVDWEYAASAVRELAKMHSLSYAYSAKRPKEFEKVLALLKAEFKERLIREFSRGSLKAALNSVAPEYKEALERFIKTYDLKDMFMKLCVNVVRPVIVHGDFRGNNLMHKVREDGTVDIKIVDLQTLQGGSPVTDLLYFIFTGSDEQFRAQHYDRLIDHYYSQLSAAMKRLHLDPEEVYSRSDFDAELKEKLPYGLMLAVFALPMVTVDEEDAPQVDESLEISDFSMGKTSDLYVERLNGVVNDFVKWGILK